MEAVNNVVPSWITEIATIENAKTLSPEPVLEAVRPEDDGLVSAVLEGYFEDSVRHSLAEAEKGLDEAVGLIVCGVHFDQGAMFDLLAAAKAHPVTCRIPFYLILREETHYSRSVTAGIRRAAVVRGAMPSLIYGS